MSSRIRSDFGTLQDRMEATRAAQEKDAAPARIDRTARPSNHWVLIDGVEEALLGKWRRDENGSWEALVARVGGVDDFWAEWIPADRLSPPDRR